MKRIQGSSAFFNGDVLLCHDRMTCRVDPQYRKCTYHKQADRPHYRMTSSGKQFFLVRKSGPLQNKPQQIRDHDGQNNVQQDPQPVVTDHFQESLKIRMWQQKCDDNAECQKRVQDEHSDLNALVFEYMMTASHPPDRPSPQIPAKQQVTWC